MTRPQRTVRALARALVGLAVCVTFVAYLALAGMVLGVSGP